MSRTRRQQGFALVGAIFILVSLAGVGAAMLNISAAHQATSTFALLGSRAYHAARSGTEWAVYDAVTNGGCPAATFSLNEGATAGFDVQVTCTSSAHTEGVSSQTILQIESTAEYGSFGDRDYVARTLSATIVR